MSYLDRSALIEAIKQSIYKTGREAFKESQNKVPIVTGELKRSGTISENYEGVIIRYAKEYASFVERDWEGGRVWTNSFIKSNGVQVKGHYKNQPPRKGRHFIENSLNKHFKEKLGTYTTFQANLIEELKQRFPSKKIV
jgi:hypothetical protein